jgi:ribosomal protein S24E
MDFKITGKAEKPMLDRTEFTCEVSFQGAVPSRAELKKKIAAGAGVHENLVVIKRIRSVKGYGRATIEAYAYKDEGSMKKIEYAYIAQRGMPKQEGGQSAGEKAEAKEPASKKQEAA